LMQIIYKYNIFTHFQKAYPASCFVKQSNISGSTGQTMGLHAARGPAV